MDSPVNLVKDIEVENKVVEIIANAQSQIILITNWMSLENQIIRMLIGALQQKKEIVIITRLTKRGQTREAIEKLISLGAKIYFDEEFDIKLCIIDKSQIILSSTTFTGQSNSIEFQCLGIYSKDQSLVSQTFEYTQNLIKKIENTLNQLNIIEEEDEPDEKEEIEDIKFLKKEERVRKIEEPLRNLTTEEWELFQKMRKWRLVEAEKDRVPPYVIAHDRLLKALIICRVKSIEDMLKIKGFGRKLADKYGSALLTLITNHFQKNEAKFYV